MTWVLCFGAVCAMVAAQFFFGFIVGFTQPPRFRARRERQLLASVRRYVAAGESAKASEDRLCRVGLAAIFGQRDQAVASGGRISCITVHGCDGTAVYGPGPIATACFTHNRGWEKKPVEAPEGVEGEIVYHIIK